MSIWKKLKGEEPNFFDKLMFKIEHGNDKGAYGEFLTTHIVNNIYEHHRIITNIYLPYNGITTEIDIALITTKGIYVIENKNYSGWVFGNEQYKNWYQTFPNGQKYTFYNPIWQNRNHIKALSKFLNININLLYSFIVFSGENFKVNIKYFSNDFTLATYENVLDILKFDLSRKYNVLTPYDVDNIARLLYNCSNANSYIKNQHIQDVNRIKNQR